MPDHYTCPVCGYPDLPVPAWINKSPSDEICPSCGTQFGYHDFADGDPARRKKVHRSLRAKWIEAGCPWHSKHTPPPEGWNPSAQLAAVED